jgi:hypothetical protein
MNRPCHTNYSEILNQTIARVDKLIRDLPNSSPQDDHLKST